MFILCPSNVNEDLGNELYKLVLPMESKRRGLKKRTLWKRAIYKQKHSTKIKMSPLVIHTIKSINYLIDLQISNV